MSTVTLQPMFSEYVIFKKLLLPTNEYSRYCFELQESTSSVSASNEGGWHSDNIVNDSRFKNLKAQIIQAVDEHCRNIHCLNKFYVSALWVNINYQYNFNKLHNHTSSVFSGVYYVNVPEHSGNLVFERGDNSYMWSADSLDFNEFNCYNSQLWNIAPQENYIYLFPSNQMHRVDPNLSEEPRISISFNINRED